jgi:hypothetical protein
MDRALLLLALEDLAGADFREEQVGVFLLTVQLGRLVFLVRLTLRPLRG